MIRLLGLLIIFIFDVTEKSATGLSSMRYSSCFSALPPTLPRQSCKGWATPIDPEACIAEQIHVNYLVQHTSACTGHIQSKQNHTHSPTKVLRRSKIAGTPKRAEKLVRRPQPTSGNPAGTDFALVR